MRFGEIPVREAEGAILAHSLKLGATVFKKGRLLSASDVAALTAARMTDIVAARLDPGDLREDAAADRIAAAIAGTDVTASPAFTGRANLYAETRGLLVFDRDRLDRHNLVDEAVTLGTLPQFAIVEPRRDDLAHARRTLRFDIGLAKDPAFFQCGRAEAKAVRQDRACRIADRDFAESHSTKPAKAFAPGSYVGTSAAPG